MTLIFILYIFEWGVHFLKFDEETEAPTLTILARFWACHLILPHILIFEKGQLFEKRIRLNLASKHLLVWIYPIGILCFMGF